jgi:hypothetical protein
MVSGGEPIRIGPFVGGLNTGSDPTAVADAELVDCQNLELDIDGSLVCRPPIQTVATSGTFTERIYLLGVGQFSSGNYLIGSNTNGVFQFSGGVWTLITNTFQAFCMVQYAGKVYLPPKPGSANPGGKWDPVGGYTAVAAIPQGEAAKIYKERMYLAPGKSATTNESRLKYSNAGNFDVWGGSDFVDVRPGDGTKLVDLVIYQDNIILLKEDSTYVFAYDTRPADAVLRDISQIIGATRRNCVVDYEDAIFIYHEGKVYEMVGFNFNRINTKVPFTYDPTQPSGGSGWAEEVWIARFGDRLVVRYYNKIYVYGLRTQTWSRWESVSESLHYLGPIIAMPSNVASAINDEYYAGSAITNKTTVVRINDGYDETTEENDGSALDITCKVQTKNFDLAIPQQFKRLWYWAIDVLTNRSVTGVVNPVVVTFDLTWGDLALTEWGDLTTWEQPLTDPATITVAVATGTGVNRRVIKLPKSLRYRQISFQVTLVGNGTVGDGPPRLFTINMITDAKQVVSKQVS